MKEHNSLIIKNWEITFYILKKENFYIKSISVVLNILINK